MSTSYSPNSAARSPISVKAYFCRNCNGSSSVTAAAVSEDLARYGDGNTVQAHRPSRWYWLRKFVARNRLMVASAALASAALLIGTAVALWQAREAEQQAELKGAPDVLVTVPFFDADIYDMAGLLRLGALVWE